MPTTFVVSPAHRPLRRRPPEAHIGQTAFREKPPEAKRRCTRRNSTAASRLRSFCSRKAPRWTPRRTTARASIREAGARHRVSPTWGASKKSWEQMITSGMLMNDHNAICRIRHQLCIYIYIYCSIFIDIVSLKVICRKQDVLKLVECVCKLFVNIFCV